MELLAVTAEPRWAVRNADRMSPVVGDAKAALVVAYAQLEVGCVAQLVVFEAEEMPVIVRWCDHIVQLTGRGIDARVTAGELNELAHPHHVRAGCPRASDPQDSGSSTVHHRGEAKQPPAASAV